MPTPYDIQLAQRQKEACELLATLPQASEMKWLPAAASVPEHYRSKAKFAVGGSAEHPTLGITGSAPNYAGVDLPHCIAHTEVIASTIEPLKAFIRELHLEPYDIARSKLSLLHSLIPAAQVITVNILPAHAALVEGDEEIVISEQQTLPMLVGDVELHLGPRSFSQTNTTVASQLYRQVAQWAHESGATSLWDLYCGVGGFALHAALGGVERVSGVEISPEAIASAQETSEELGVSERVSLVAGDAQEWAFAQDRDHYPEAIVVNPPRRGIGTELAQWINQSDIPTMIYSSCYPKSLVSDLRLMNSYRLQEARLFDMFPHTNHMECAVLLTKVA